jgi:predicted ATP-grasp superfamily ATP-dependent carboligase
MLRSVLSQLARQFAGPGVLFPTTDTALLTVAMLRDQVPEYVTFIPPRHLVELMVIKSLFYRSLTAHGVPHPVTLYPEALNLREIASTLGFPVFIRPEQSLLFYERFRCKGFVAHDLGDVRHHLRVTARHQLPVMIQEIIPGPGDAGFSMRGYLDHHSRVMALMALQKHQQPSLFTPLTVKRSIPLTQLPYASQALTAYLHAIQYRGLFFAEWKRDPRDGVLKLLEINARSAGGNYFGVTCGMNHIWLAYQDALGHPITPLTRYQTGIYGINLLPNLVYQLSQLLQRRFTPRNLLPYLHRNQYLILSRRDGRPFLHALAQALRVNPLRDLV